MTDKLHQLAPMLRGSSHPARLWRPVPDGRVECLLSPRHCKIPPGGLGFCGVRYNDGGRLVTLNYGKSVPITQEVVETEAVYHYAPGARTLSLGNIGCMLKCDFCQNWQTSQARLARDQDMALYTPEGIVDTALRHGIGILSWTYNDPVVWQEFVLDTARLARQAGLKNLYKSAFFISPQGIEELLEVMDIFSISLKSMSADYYTRITHGQLQPVLDGIEQIYRARQADGCGPHLEISNLCVTGRNDNLADAAAVAHWMLERLDADVPLHYVRFHPDYLYTQVERTSPAFLEQARQQALQAGLRYVYVGNCRGTPSAHTFCPQCQTPVVLRHGGAVRKRLTHDGACPQCSSAVAIVWPVLKQGAADTQAGTSTVAGAVATPAQTTLTHTFRTAIAALHVEQDREQPICYTLLDAQDQPMGEAQMSSCLRFLISPSGPDCAGVRLQVPADVPPPRLFEVYDRAHYPTVDAQHSLAASADVPPAAIEPR